MESEGGVRKVIPKTLFSSSLMRDKSSPFVLTCRNRWALVLNSGISCSRIRSKPWMTVMCSSSSPGQLTVHSSTRLLRKEHSSWALRHGVPDSYTIESRNMQSFEKSVGLEALHSPKRCDTVLYLHLAKKLNVRCVYLFRKRIPQKRRNTAT